MTKKAAPAKRKKLTVKKETIKDLDVKSTKGAVVKGGGKTFVECIHTEPT